MSSSTTQRLWGHEPCLPTPARCTFHAHLQMSARKQHHLARHKLCTDRRLWLLVLLVLLLSLLPLPAASACLLPIDASLPWRPPQVLVCAAAPCYMLRSEDSARLHATPQPAAVSACIPSPSPPA
jgi:hypothetical protein